MKNFYMGIAICLALASVCAAEDKTAIAYWSASAKVDSSGNFAGNGASLTNIGASALQASIVTNVLTDGMVLPAVDYSGATNGAAGNIESGNLALARITNALFTSGPSIKGNIPVASITNALTTGGSSIGGDIPIAATTNALKIAVAGSATALAVTNASTLMTNTTYYGAGGVLLSNVYVGP